MPQDDKVCTRCVMDSTDPAITFDDFAGDVGVFGYRAGHAAQHQESQKGRQELFHGLGSSLFGFILIAGCSADRWFRN